MKPDVSIVILSYCQVGLVKQLLKLLAQFKLPFAVETIVVDNASPTKSALALADQFPNVKFIGANRNAGFAAGNNIGIKAATGEYVLILNPDVAPSAQSLVELYQFMQQHQSAGIAGPQLTNADGTYQLSCAKFPDWRLPLFRRTWMGKTKVGKAWLDNVYLRQWDHAEARQVDWLFGAVLMVRRSAMDKVGLLDERFFLYFEDLDWCRRFHAAGYEVWYVPSSRVVHFHQRDSLDGGGLGDLLNPITRAHIASWIKYLLKWH